MRRPLYVLLLCLLLVAPARAATLQVSPPARLGADGADPVLAALPGGGFAVAWLGTGAAPGVYVARTGSADVQRLTDRPALEVALAAGADGRLAAAWIDGAYSGNAPKLVKAAVAEPGAAFGEPVELAGSEVDQVWRPRVAIAADGVVAVGYQVFRQNLGAPAVVRLRPPGGEFGGPQALWPVVTNGPDLAPDASGRIVAMWSGVANPEQGPLPRVIMVAQRESGADAFGAPATLSSTDTDADNNVSPPAMAVNGRGDAVVAWSPMRISMGPVWPGPASASFRPAGGAWTAPQELLASGMRPQVAINAGGDSVAISQSGPGGLGASFRPAGGSAFDADWPATLSRGAHMSQAVGLDDAGNAVAVDSATAPDPAPGISAVIRPPAGCFGEEVDVSPRGVAVGRAALALRGDGTGAVAWASEEGGRWNVNLAELRLAPGGRTECPPGTPARPRPQAPAAPLPATKLSVSATPTRVSRRTLWREGLRFRIRAAKGSPVGAAIMPEGQLLTKLAHVRGRTGRRGLTSLRVRVKRSVAATLPRGAKLELWVYAAAPGHQVAGKIRKLTVR